MKNQFRFSLATMALCLVVAPFLNGQETSASAELDRGIQAYKNAKYEEAIPHFKQAVALDPSLVVPHLYLATAYARQYIPGAEFEENNQMALQASEEFEKVLALNPTREQEMSSLKGIASLYFNMKKLDTAKNYHKKVLKIRPDDPETYYAIGVIDWTEAYQPRMEERAKFNLKPDAPLIYVDACWKVRAANEEPVRDGIEMLTKALTVRPDYDDAMAYMNLMYRERADIQCGDRQAYQNDINAADQWVDLTMATKKRKAEAAREKTHEKN